MKLRQRLALTVLATAVPLVAGLAWARAAYERRTAEQGLREFVLARMESGGRENCEASPETFPEPPRRRDAGLQGLPLSPRERAELRDLMGPDGPGPGREPRPPSDLDRRPPPEADGPGARGPGDPRGPRPGPGPAQRMMAEIPPPRTELWAYDPAFHSSNLHAPPFPDALKRALEHGQEYASTAWDLGDHSGMQFAMKMSWSEGPCAVMLARRPEIGPPGAVRDLLLGSAVLCFVLLGAVLLAAGPLVERVRRLKGEVHGAAAERYATPIGAIGNDEIAELATAFNQAGAQVRENFTALEKREKTLRTFVENTTHDVMLPLTVLQGHLTAVRRSIEAGAVPDREIVRDALEESHYMASLFQNLAIAAKLEAGEPDLERHIFDVNQLVERAVGRHRTIAKQRSIAIEFAVPEPAVWIEGDVTLVEQALSNVIHNAVRYNHDGGHVAVVLEECGEAKDEFALRVLDDGPGIPDELRPRVLERSFRTDAARSRHPDGLGLGLAIAKDVADRHGFAMEMRRSQFGGLEVELRGRRSEAPSTRPREDDPV